MATVTLDGNHMTLDHIYQISKGAKIHIHSDVKKHIDASQRFVSRICSSDKAVYGINTGFGYLAKHKIGKSKLKELQVNLLKSHASGYGNPLPIPETRLAMALRLNVLLKGITGVNYQLCEALASLINAEIYPIIPEYGSVGASGDLAPLAHLALPLIGCGKVRYQNRIMGAKAALKKAGLEPYQLQEKEGLSLINGTQVMLAVGSLSLLEAVRLLDKADLIAALSYEALIGNIDALHPLIHQVRGQTGQITSAFNILSHLEGSYLFDSSTKRMRVQDPYSLRCAPQIHGPSRDAVSHAKGVVVKELNATTDNPLVFVDQLEILSGGNFHGQCLAFAFDIASMAIAEIGNVSERRLELLLNPHFNGLSAFLAPVEGTHSGYMAAQYLSASLVNENKLLANPSCTDSIPGNVGVEDHVSMGMTSARKFKKIVSNARAVLAAELVAAAQCIDLRKTTKLGRDTSNLYQRVRQKVPMLKKDRIISEDIHQAVKLLEDL
jgi:histidine ammonia-lyase